MIEPIGIKVLSASAVSDGKEVIGQFDIAEYFEDIGAVKVVDHWGVEDELFAITFGKIERSYPEKHSIYVLVSVPNTSEECRGYCGIICKFDRAKFEDELCGYVCLVEVEKHHTVLYVGYLAVVAGYESSVEGASYRDV